MFICLLIIPFLDSFKCSSSTINISQYCSCMQGIHATNRLCIFFYCDLARKRYNWFYLKNKKNKTQNKKQNQNNYNNNKKTPLLFLLLRLGIYNKGPNFMCAEVKGKNIYLGLLYITMLSHQFYTFQDEKPA